MHRAGFLLSIEDFHKSHWEIADPKEQGLRQPALSARDWYETIPASYPFAIKGRTHAGRR
jgi:hypothetical protein